MPTIPSILSIDNPVLRATRAGALLAAVLFAGASALAQQATTRISLDSSGNEGNADSQEPSISADGRYVAFGSLANDLVAGDTNGSEDIFVRDTLNGVTQRVSVSTGGGQANASSESGSISDDGRYVAFHSQASNLVAGDTNAEWDVFVHDRLTGATERISVDSAESQANSWSFGPVISGDGRWVAFYSPATNLVPGSNGQWQVYVRDRQAGVTEAVSIAGSTWGNGPSYPEEISADGRYVVFDSLASNLVAGDTNAQWDVFVRDRQAALTERVSVDSAEIQGNDVSQGGAISDDGRYAAFHGVATNLVAGDTNGLTDVFVRDRQAGTTERVSVDSFGNQTVFGGSLRPSITPDGRYVAFDSQATNLVPAGTNGYPQVFVRDRQSGVTEIASIDSSGNQGNEASSRAALSQDGNYVAFDGQASNLVANDTNGVPDVFVRNRSCIDQFVNYCTAGFSASGCSVRLRSTGIASPSAPSGFVVLADFVEGSKDGVFFFGQNGKQANSWGNGTSFQCVVPPVHRGGALAASGTNGACNGSFGQDLNARWCPTCPKPAHAPIPGKQLQIQFWYRDPLNTSNQTTSLSDAIEVAVCP